MPFTIVCASSGQIVVRSDLRLRLEQLFPRLLDGLLAVEVLHLGGDSPRLALSPDAQLLLLFRSLHPSTAAAAAAQKGPPQPGQGGAANRLDLLELAVEVLVEITAK